MQPQASKGMAANINWCSDSKLRSQQVCSHTGFIWAFQSSAQKWGCFKRCEYVAGCTNHIWKHNKNNWGGSFLPGSHLHMFCLKTTWPPCCHSPKTQPGPRCCETIRILRHELSASQAPENRPKFCPKRKKKRIQKHPFSGGVCLLLVSGRKW